jgi:hypothetical protein
MNKHVTIAVRRLQGRLRTARSFYIEQQIEEALNLLLKNPHKTATPEALVRDAMREASRKLKKREALFEAFRIRTARKPQRGRRPGPTRFEIEAFVGQDVEARDRPLLEVALAGGSAPEIARLLSIPRARAAERLSRARSRAFRRWQI